PVPWSPPVPYTTLCRSLLFLEVAVQRRAAAAGQRQAGQQQDHNCQALVCVRRFHAAPRLTTAAGTTAARHRTCGWRRWMSAPPRSEEHTSELQSRGNLV